MNKTIGEKRWLVKLGKNIKKVILTNGYFSVYEFWKIKCQKDGIPRSSLHNITTGRTEPKILSLRKIAKKLNVDIGTFFDFE